MRLRLAAAALASAFALTACGGETLPVETMLEGRFTIPGDLLPADAVTDEVGYLLWLPAGYDVQPDRSWPLVVSLHGAGDVDNDPAWVGSMGLPAVLNGGDEPRPFNYIVLVPLSAPGTPWAAQTDALAALIGEVAATRRVDPAAVVLTGFDTGGEGALLLGARHPDLVRAVVAVSTAVTAPLADSDLCDLRRMRVRLVHGKADLISPLPALRGEVGALEQRCAFDVDLVLTEHGHFGTIGDAYRDLGLFEWIDGVLAP